MKANNLRVGDQILVPAMYKLWDGETYVVDTGDSLWKIATEHMGGGANFRQIFESNKDFIVSPNVIYPIQTFNYKQ